MTGVEVRGGKNTNSALPAGTACPWPAAGEVQALTVPAAGTGGSTTGSLTGSDPSHISHVLSCHISVEFMGGRRKG